MPPGTSLDADEKEYILRHAEDGPGAITHALNTDPRYVQHNHGDRRRNTVEVFLYREKKKTAEILELEIPVHVIREAREKGISQDQIRFVALRAILKRVKTAG
jgi:hypothetical protein